MYSIFLPFAAVVVDLSVAFIYFKHDWWLGGGTTALIALIPLFMVAFLLYSGWTRLKQVGGSNRGRSRKGGGPG